MISLPALGALGVAMFVLWLLATALRNVSIVDIFWGPAFAVVVATCLVTGKPALPQWVLAGMVAVWSLRLALYLAWRNHGQPEDRRYAAMRKNRGPSFWWFSFFQVFALQGVLAWLVSLPLQGALLGSTTELGALSWVGLALWATGLAFETIGDQQLAHFLADPNNAGKVMDQGLWRYTRHPNYFGEFTLWWGYFVFALGCGAAWWTIAGPLLMSVLLLRVSGVTMLEKTIEKRRPGYEEYIRRTSAFFPRPPKPPAES